MRILKLNPQVELVVALVAAIQGAYLSLISFMSPKRSLSGILLSIAFVSVTLRIIKSLLWVYMDNVDLWILNIGFLSHSVYGPALFLLLYCEIFQKRWSNKFFIHFAPSLFLLLTISSLSLDGFWYSNGYAILLVQQAAYITASWILFFLGLRRGQLVHDFKIERKYWYILLLSGGFLLQFAYFSNYMLGLTPYLLGPMVYAVFLFVTSIFVFKHPQVLVSPQYRTNKTIAPREAKQVKSRLVRYMEEDQPFLNPNCTLSVLAKEIDTQPYKLSYLINKEFDQNFATFLNSHRIERAMQMLKDPMNHNIKISAIAFDCGFNSLSSFNQAFKKITSQTPSKFREKQMLTES